MFKFFKSLYQKLFGPKLLEVQIIPLPLSTLAYEYLYKTESETTWSKYTITFVSVMVASGHVTSLVQRFFNERYGRPVKLKFLRDKKLIKSLIKQALDAESPAK